MSDKEKSKKTTKADLFLSQFKPEAHEKSKKEVITNEATAGETLDGILSYVLQEMTNMQNAFIVLYSLLRDVEVITDAFTEEEIRYLDNYISLLRDRFDGDEDLENDAE